MQLQLHIFLCKKTFAVGVTQKDRVKNPVLL